MGWGASSSTSKTVILSKSQQPDHDVDYLFGQVAIDRHFVDWSGNCGNLTAGVGSFAISNGLVDSSRIPENGICTVRIWQVNIQKTIIAHVPIVNGQVQELVILSWMVSPFQRLKFRSNFWTLPMMMPRVELCFRQVI